MNNLQRLHTNFISDRLLYLVVVVLFIVFRFLGVEKWENAELWISTGIQIGIAFLLVFLNQTFGMIRGRTALPAIFFLLLTGTNPLYFNDLTGSISALVIIVCLFWLLGCYQNPNSQLAAFNIALLLTLGSFYWPPLIVFFPLVWFGMFRFRSLNIKSFVAFLLGFLLVFLFLITWSIYSKDNISLFLDELFQYDALRYVQYFPFELRESIVIGFLLLLFVLSGFKIFMADISEKVKSITILSWFFIFTLVVLVFYIIQYQFVKEWGLILHIPFAFLLSHYFSSPNNRGNSWLFLFTILFFVLFFVSLTVLI
ncbi:MAG: hypothetical protein LBV57_03225 [Candidatus Symbiothrix sp.]|jgi:hypothetical protein|nr:hypothetical protein [Candidatus Symbiothrix sp.]